MRRDPRIRGDNIDFCDYAARGAARRGAVQREFAYTREYIVHMHRKYYLFYKHAYAYRTRVSRSRNRAQTPHGHSASLRAASGNPRVNALLH